MQVHDKFTAHINARWQGNACNIQRTPTLELILPSRDIEKYIIMIMD